MRDLYRQLGFSSTRVDTEAITKALKEQRVGRDIDRAVKHILLDPKRKPVYDRNRSIVAAIAQLRANLGLKHSPGWVGNEDFNVTADRTGSELERLKRATSSPTAGYETKRVGEDKHDAMWLLGAAVRRHPYWTTAILVLTLLVGVVALRESDGKEPTNSTGANSIPSQPPKRELTWEEKLEVARARPKPFSEPEQPLPPNGSVEKYYRGGAYGLLTIKTASSGSSHYYIKLANWYSKRSVVLCVFVRAGQSASVSVPRGVYEIRYAAGGKWYGTEHLFGPNTAYAKADESFEFKDNTHWTIELYLQPGGNLETQPMREEDF